MNKSGPKKKTRRVAPEPASAKERKLRAEVLRLRARLSDAAETVRAIQAREVDALVVHGHVGEQIFTLKGAERSYRLLVETMSEGAATFREDGTILYCNTCFAKMVDAPIERVMGANIRDFIIPEHHEMFRALVRQGSEHDVKSEITFAAPYTRSVPVYVSLSPLLGEDESGLLCLIATDLSAQKRSDEMLASGRLATSVIEQAAGAMLVCDLGGRIIRASKGAFAFAKDSPLFSLFSDAFPSDALASVVTVALGGQSLRGIVASLAAEEGRQVDVLASGAPLLGTSGEIVGVVVTMTDVSDLKRTQTALESAVKIRDEFVSIASHELRTPLTSLQLQLESFQILLERDGESVANTRWSTKLAAAMRHTRRLSKLTDALLDISRLNTGRFLLDLEEFDLTHAAGETVDGWHEEANRTGCELRFHEGAPSVGFWDRLRIEQALINLISNAIKYAPGKPVDISIDVIESQVWIAVQDRGLGIDAKDKERIFQQFERAVSSRHYGGLGLGLFITRQIVEASGGSIDVTSEMEKGSTFRICLPIRTQAPILSALPT